MDKFEEFNLAHQKAIDEIKEFLKPSKYEPSMHKLVEWMMTTDANPYDYLPEKCATALYSAQSFSGLLSMIHHALYDDGVISFVEVNGQPRIVFAHPTDHHFREMVLTEQEKGIEDNPYGPNPRPYNIQVLNIKPEEFGLLYDQYQVSDLKRCFVLDGATFGIDFAIEHYEKFKCWNESWIKELTPEINRRIERIKRNY